MGLLIIAPLRDDHALAVMWSLRRAGLDSWLWDPTAFPSQGTISLNPTELQTHRLEVHTLKGERVDLPLQHVKAVWCRRMMRAAPYLDFSHIHPADLGFVIEQASGMIRNVWDWLATVLADVPWVNPLNAHVESNSKGKQLLMAQRAGFAIPPTLISNHPQQVRAFCEQHQDDLIYKTFTPASWQDEPARSLPTSRVCLKDLQDDQAIQSSPGIYQARIEKAHELRVLVCGTHILAARIHSQEQAASSTDWRTQQGQLRMEPCELKADDRARIRSFMQGMGLAFGSLDLVVTPQDELVFLEVNEQGQFLFLESHCPALPALATVSSFFAEQLGLRRPHPWPDFASCKADAQLAEWRNQHHRHRPTPTRSIAYRFIEPPQPSGQG
ncbi:RimK family alpha-L-glutamate ligase [Leeia sp.]|uniref:ATP-grasp domain-containing protein n=1 Tax=Leeia sp. TaxID=2884678 RepID=UPI0035B35EC9